MRRFGLNPWSEHRRAVVLALAVTWVGLMLSAAFPEPASADKIFGVIPNPVDWFKAGAGVVGDVIVSGFVKLLNWLFGTLVSTVTIGLIKFLTSVDLTFGGPLRRVSAPVVVVGGFFLLLGTLATVMQGMGAVAAGMDTPGRAIGSALFKLGGLALLMASWFAIVPLAVDLANGMRDYVLTDAAVKDALKQTFIGTAVAGSISNAVAPVLMIIVLLLAASTLVVLLILKYVLIFTFALLYVGGPVAIGAGAFPGIGSAALNGLVRMLFVCMCIPLAWCIVFVAWAGVSAGLAAAPSSPGAAALKIINGPGIFCAAMFVVLGVTRALLKIATPLGAPLNIPGARMAMAMAAYKVGGPALAKLGAGAGGAGSAGADTISPAADTQQTASYDRAPIPPPGAQGGQACEAVTAAAADAPARVSASPDAIAAVRERVAAHERQHSGAGSGTSASDGDVNNALNGLDESERANVEQMASESLAQSEPESHFRESVIASAARNEFTNLDHATLLATASPEQIQAAGGGQAGPPARVHPPPEPSPPGLEYRPDELVGGSGRSAPEPPPASPPPSKERS